MVTLAPNPASKRPQYAPAEDSDNSMTRNPSKDPAS